MPFVLALFFLYSISIYTDLTPLAVHTGSAWYQYITFHFCHTTFLHLFTNCLAFLLYWKIQKRHTNLLLSIPTVIISSLLATIIGLSHTPTMGASTIIYAMIGIYMAGMKSPYNIPKRVRIKYTILIISSLLLTACMSNINTPMHIYALSTSFLLSHISKKFMYATKDKK